MIFFGGTIYIPSPFKIYCSLIIELLQSIINLENEYMKFYISDEEKKIIIDKIKFNLKLVGYFFEDEKNKQFINTELPIDINNNIVSFKDSSAIVNYVNPLVVFVNNFKLNWVKYTLVTTWEKYGGNYANIYTNTNTNTVIVKKDIIIFINELEKKLSLIDKNIIKKYIGTLYTSIDDFDLKLKLNTFQVYLVIKNNRNLKNSNKIFEINNDIFFKLDKYYELGIDIRLLTKEQTNRIYNTYERYWDEILPDQELTPIIINKYIEFLKLQEDPINMDKKIDRINLRYYSYTFENLIANKNYKNYRHDIISCYNTLKTLGYNFKKEQSDKVKTLNIKLNFEGQIPYQFNPDNYFPLFYYDELCKLKNDILSNKDNLCGIIKKMYPLYNITHDLFCKIEPSGEKKYLDEETINKTINFYCVILLVVGIINYQLKKYNQDYMIVLKGGKALQLILSGMDAKSSVNFKSNDIDLVISPVEGKKYSDKKCKYFGVIICLLLQWILNPTKNMYKKDYWVSYKLPDSTDPYLYPYPYVIKLSHKIQYSDDDPDSYYTAVSDIDFNEIAEKKFYSDLIFDNKNLDSIFPNLLFVYQNFNNYLLEKIYYVYVNFKITNGSSKLDLEKKKILDKNVLLTMQAEKNIELVGKIKSKINYNDNLIRNNNENFNDNIGKLQKLKFNLDQIYFETTKYQQYPYQQNNKENQENYNMLIGEYNRLAGQFNEINKYNEDLTRQIRMLRQNNKENQDKIKKLNETNTTTNANLKNNLEILKIIKKDMHKMLSDENNSKRFIKKFSNQIKLISEFVVKKNEIDIDSIYLDKQKEFIEKLIKDNNVILEFDDETIENVIGLIFSDDLE
jgi:hypothetical protein